MVSGHKSNGNCTQILPSERTAGVFSRSITVTNKSNSLTYIVASSFVSTLPLAVTTVVGCFDVLTVSNSALFRSFLVTMCILAPESPTNSLSLGPCGCGRKNPLLRGRIECSFVFLFELIDILGKFPRISAGTSLLSCSLFWRSLLKCHSVGSSLMKNFDLYFTKRWTCIFSDVCLTQCSPRESYSSNWFQHFCAHPINRCRIWPLSVL